MNGSQTSAAYKRSLKPGFAAVKARMGASAPVVPPVPTVGAPTAALPVDPTYDQQIGALTKRRDDTLAGIRQQRTGSLLDYGYTAQQDAQGNVTGLTFDPTNPNSQAALLLKHYQRSKEGTGNSLAARGQLYSGAMINAQNANDQSYQQSDDAQRKALLAFLSRNTQAQTDAGTAYEFDAGGAMGSRIDRAGSSPLYNPATGAPPKPAPLTVKQADPSNWVVGAPFMRNGRKVKRMGDGRVVPA